MTYRNFFTACVAALALAASPCALAQAWPAKPIRIVVPFPAGGATDIMAHAAAQKMTEAWNQPVVVDNRPGAAGNIGAELVARSPNDGYTMLMGTVGTHAINASLYAKMPYDHVKDFAPVGLVAAAPNVLVVHPSVPANSVQELIAFGKANPVLRQAQAHPEQYRDLVVRIGGYTDYFTRLTPEMQAEVILRTEYQTI